LDTVLITEEIIVGVLAELEISNAEASVYIALSRRGPKQGKELLKTLKISRPNLYRSLRNLQNEGLIYATMEKPSRFFAYPFDIVCKLAIERKMNEVAILKKNQDELKNFLNPVLTKEELLATPKMMMIDGEKNVFRKAAEMICESKYESLAILTVKDLVSANNFGLYEAINFFPQEQCKHRFLTSVVHEEIPHLKKFLEHTKGSFNLKGRVFRSVPTSLIMFSRFIVNQKEAFLFSGSYTTEANTANSKALGLWTDNPSIVSSLRMLFEFLWEKSISIEKKVDECEKCSRVADIDFFTEPESAKKKADAIILNANKEILAVLSKSDVKILVQKQEYLRKLSEKIKIKIIAPLSREEAIVFNNNLPSVQLRFSNKDYLSTAIIDNQYIIINKGLPLQDTEYRNNFDMIFCSNDSDTVKGMKNVIDDLWHIATPIDSLGNSVEQTN
jgi:sugar-specific transcriptional regulator TrmB